MLYRNKSFSVPVGNAKLTDEQYEIAVGLRCPECRKKPQECKCPPPSQH